MPWYDRIIGFFAASLPLFAAMLISRGGMGFGDVKLAAAAGLVLGWRLALFSLLAACITGSIYGLWLTAAKKGSLKTAIPFGPFLSAGFCLALLAGNRLIALYLSLLFHR